MASFPFKGFRLVNETLQSTIPGDLFEVARRQVLPIMSTPQESLFRLQVLATTASIGPFPQSIRKTWPHNP
jgi:hypothetical protein